MPDTIGSLGLEAARRLFAHFPDAPLQINDRGTSIEFIPTGADTFPVTIYDQGDDAMIAAGRWHTHYDDPDQLAWCVVWLLSPFYRLVEELKGGVLVAIWIERYEATGWEGFEPVFYMNPEDAPSWQAKGDETFARRYHGQRVVELPMPYTQFEPEATIDDNGLPPDFHAGKRLVHDHAAQALELV